MNRTGHKHRNRRGAALLMVLLALFAASLIMASLVHTVMRQHRQARHDRDRVQSEWCADAGLQRALHRLADDAAYAGETWTVVPDDTENGPGAQIEIKLQSAASGRQIQVVAEYPAGAVHRVRTRRELLWPSSPSAESPLSALQSENR